jgi:2-dehydropantoate 2-reductase
MRIAVVGAGGVGGYYGALLHQSGHDVTFLARGRHLEAIQTAGLRIESTLGAPLVFSVRASSAPADAGPVELVLFTVKSYDSAAAATTLAPLLAPGAAVLTLQNGVENIEVLAAAVGRGRVLGGLCQIFCHIAAPGVIRHTGGPRRVVLGELDGEVTPRAEAAHAAFAGAGVPAELSRQILVDMWEKYLFISAQGGMTALTRVPVGVIRSTPATFEMYLQVAQEVASVGRAHGVPIPAGERERVRTFAAALQADAYSSLYNDLVAGRRMELDALQGAVIRLGERHGVPTPNARAIYAALLPHDAAARTALGGGPAGRAN